MENYPKDIEAEVIFVLPENGGRKGPIISGLRPQFYYDGRDWDGTIHFDLEEPVTKGIPVKMYYAFLTPQYHLGKIYPGKDFQLRDGPKIIANGQVLRLIDLENSARNLKQE